MYKYIYINIYVNLRDSVALFQSSGHAGQETHFDPSMQLLKRWPDAT